MASNIKFKRSSVQNRVPTTAQLELGELALNTYDGKLYTEINTGSAAVVEIGSKLSSLVVDGDNGGGNGDVTFHGATAGRDLLWDASADSLIALDNTKISVGTGNDLQLFHDGSDSWIKNNTGALIIRGSGGSNLIHLEPKTDENGILIKPDGEVELYHNALIRFETTVDGADIFGTGSLKIPVGTTAQRSASPTNGDLRYNSTTGGFEGYSSGGWGELGGGGVGIGSTSINPGSGVISNRIGVGFTDINFVGAGLSVTGYGSTVVVDISDAVSRRYGRNVYTYTATEGQTTFTGLSYTNATIQISVYLNGARLSASAYTATSGNTVVLTTGASVGDNVEILELFSGVDLSRTLHSFTATAGQTTFTGLSYLKKKDLDVYLNGIRLSQTDYTATDGASVVLSLGASVNDLIEVIDMGAGATWSVGGTEPEDVYRLDGGVGIGTTNPTDKLNVIGNAEVIGILTATTFKGDGSQLTGIVADKIFEGNTEVETVDTGSDGHIKFTTEGSERLRITNAGKLDITNPSSGNVINLGSSTVYANAAINIYRLGNGYADMRLSSNYGAKIALAGASNNTDEFYIQQDNGKNGYIWNEANKGITFGTNATGRMWLDSSGNFKVVGISTFNSSVHVSGDLDVAADIRHIGDTDTRLRFETDTISARTAGSERLRIDSAGNMSLGKGSDASTAYTTQLQIHSTNSTGAALHLTNSTSGSSNSDGFHLVQQGDIYHWLREGANQVFATNNAERMRITSAGLVGIGTITPNAPLQINHASPKIILEDNDNGADVSIANVGGAAVYSSDTDVVFQTANTSERLRITSGGNLTLGTTVSNERVHIHTASSLKAQQQFTNTTTGTGGGDGLVIGITGGEDSIFWNQENTNMLFATNNAERLRITSAGALQFSDVNSPNDQNTDVWVADDVLNFNAFGTNGAFIFKSGSSSTERLRITSGGNLKLPDNGKIELGAAQTGAGDLQIFHDGSNSYVKDQGTGQLVIDGNAVILQYSAATKFETTSTGAKVTGNLEVTGVLTYDDVTNIDSVGIVTARDDVNIIGDNKKLKFGAGNDLNLYSTGTNGWVYTPQSGADLYMGTNSGEVYIQTGSSGNDTAIKVNSGGSVDLYHNNQPKVVTTSYGLRLTDNYIETTQSSTSTPVLRLGDTGVANYDFTFPDNATIKLSTNTTSTKQFELRNAGSGNFDLLLADNGKAKFGDSNDLQIYHNSTGNLSTISNSHANGIAVRSNVIMLQNSAGDHDYLTTANEAGVTLYYDNAARFATTSDGATLTGRLNPAANNTYGLGQASLRWANFYSVLGDFSGAITATSSNSGKYVRMYGSSGTGRWDIYGHGANLRFSDNDSAGSIVFDQNVDANGGLDVTGTCTATTFSGSGASLTNVNATTLDSIDSGSFLRSDAADTCSGQMTFTNTVVMAMDGNNQTQGGVALVVRHGTTSAMRANHFIHDDVPSGKATYYIQATEAGVSNDRNMCLQGYGGKVKVGSITNPSEVLDVTGNIAVSGTVDGRDVSLDGLKLDTYEANGSSYLRSDANDTCNGILSIAANKAIDFITGNWTGNTSGGTGKIQSHDSALYICGGDNGIRFREHGTDRWYIDGSGHFRPHSDSTYNVGSSSHRVANGYFDNITITNDGSGSGLDADTLDGVQGASYLRSDVNDTFSGQLALTLGSAYPLNINNSSDAKIVLQGSNSPYIRFREGNNDKAYIQWNSAGYLDIKNQEDSSRLLIRDSLSFSQDAINFKKVWNEYNDGSGSGLDADLLDGLHETAFVRNNSNLTRHVLRFGSGSNTGHGASTYAYAIFQESGAWSHPYPDLRINYHTGIILAANTGYGGVRFQKDYNDTTELFSVGNGDNHVRVANDLYVSGDIQAQSGAGAVSIAANSDIRFGNGSWTGESCKIQGHSNRLYIQGGSDGIILRGSDGGDIAHYQNSSISMYDPTTFSNDVTFNGSDGAVTIGAHSDIRLTSGNWTGESCKIQHHGNWLYIQGGSSGHVFRRSSGNDAWYIASGGTFYPAGDSTYDFGTNSSRIRDIYADNISLADANTMSAPSARLAIKHNSGYNMYLEGNGWSGEAGIGFGGSGTGNGVADGSTGGRIACVSSAPSGQAHGYFKFYTNPGDNLTERVRIRANGDLDIRTQDASSMTDTYQRLRFTAHQTNGQECSTAAIVAHGVSGWGGNLEFWTKDNNGTPNEQLRHTMTLQGDNSRMFMYGDIHMDGDPTTSNQARQIYWTGFDKEGTTDYSDVASIEHTTNTGGLSGSVLKIRVSNDASGDGIYLDANGGVNVANTMRMQSGNFQPRAAENSIKWQNDAFGGGGDYARIDYYRDGSGENTRLRVQIENDNDDDLRLEAGTIRAQGSFSKSGGSFLIPHPNTSAGISTTHNLAHSFIEGPQMDLIYRGKIDLSSGTASINIDTKAGMAEGTFVILCKDIQCFTSNETGWGAVKGSVSGNILTITAQDNSSTDTISWMVVGERQDPTVKSLKMTDDDGEFIVQPPKDAFELNGILPPLPAMNGAEQIT